MRAEIDIQVVWSEAKGVVQLFVGDFCIGLPPVLCEQLEKDLAAARRKPERAGAMVAASNQRMLVTPLLEKLAAVQVYDQATGKAYIHECDRHVVSCLLQRCGDAVASE